MIVYTARVSILGRDPHAIDITRSGAGKGNAIADVFAPSAPLLAWGLAGRRDGTADFAEYARRYTEEMRASYRRSRDAWDAMLARWRAVLCCYCADPTECHRTVLARDIMPRLGAKYMGELATMPALSVRQPWAWAILHGGKDIENRSGRWWARVKLPRGMIALHASSGCTRQEYEQAAEAIAEAGGAMVEPLPPLEELPRGGIVGTMRITERVLMSPSPWFIGPIGLALADRVPVPFRPCQGALGFFEVPAPSAERGPA